MADNKKNRKSNRHFNLEKYVERSFEIEKDVEMMDAAPTKPKADKQQPVAPIAPSKESKNLKKPFDAHKVDDVRRPYNNKKPSDSPNVKDVKESEQPASSYNSEGDTSEEKSSKWKWLIPAAIVAVAVPSYFFFTGNDDASSSKDQIVATAPEAGQTNAGGDATSPNASAGENGNSENVAGSDGSGDVDNVGGSENPSGSKNLGNADNTPETGNAGNASSQGSGNVGSSSSGPGNNGQTSSGAKVTTPQSSDTQSSPNNKVASVTSTASAGSNNVKAVKTETSARRGTSEPGNTKNSSTPDTPAILGSIEQKAFDVIRGIYGNGQVRKDKLGAEYADIQKLVNEMYRNGTVKR